MLTALRVTSCQAEDLIGGFFTAKAMLWQSAQAGKCGSRPDGQTDHEAKILIGRRHNRSNLVRAFDRLDTWNTRALLGLKLVDALGERKICQAQTTLFKG